MELRLSSRINYSKIIDIYKMQIEIGNIYSKVKKINYLPLLLEALFFACKNVLLSFFGSNIGSFPFFEVAASESFSSSELSPSPSLSPSFESYSKSESSLSSLSISLGSRSSASSIVGSKLS